MATVDETTPKVAIIFAPARVRQVFDSKGLNSVINEALEPHKAIVSRHKLCNGAISNKSITVKITKGPDGVLLEKPLKEKHDLTDAEVAEYKKELGELAPKLQAAKDMVELLSHEKVRFANGAAPTLAVVCEEIVKELIGNAVSTVKASASKMIYPKHIFASNLPTKYHQLYQTLACFVNKKSLFDAEQQSKRAQKDLELALALAKKEWAKENGIQSEKKREAAPKNAKAKAEKAAADEVVTQVTGVSFKVYIMHLINDFKKKNSDANIRFSDDVRNFLANITMEFVKRIAAKASIDVASHKYKTITPAVIMRAIEYLMIDGFSPKTELVFGEESRPDPSQVKPGMTAEALAALPKVQVKTVTKKITYEGSNYSDLLCTVINQVVAAGYDRKTLGL